MKKRVKQAVSVMLLACMCVPMFGSLKADAASRNDVKTSQSVEVNDSVSYAKTKQGWQKENGKWKFYHNGKYLKGWQLIEGYWYYLNPRNGYMQTGQFIENGNVYYLRTSENCGNYHGKSHPIGSMYTGFYQEYAEDAPVYFYDYSTGAKAFGWKKYNGNWYYFDKGNGKQKYGFQDIGNQTYYFTYGRGIMLTGDQKLNGQWYYFYSDGHMARNEWVGKYHYDSRGVWDKTKR